VIGRVERSLDNKESTLGIFIDIEEAFDKTTCNKINHSIAVRKTPETVTGWIFKMLSKKIIQKAW